MGWAGLMAFVPGFTGLNLGLAPILSERLGLSLGKTSILVVVIVLILSQFLINLAGVRIASRINNVAAGWPSPWPRRPAWPTPTTACSRRSSARERPRGGRLTWPP